MSETSEQLARKIFAGVGMMERLEVELVKVDEDTAELAFVVGDKHGNYMGGLHGGAEAALVDTAVFFPGRLLPSGRKLTTEGIELHFFRPAARGERITVRAEIVRVGRRVCTVVATASRPFGQGDRPRTSDPAESGGVTVTPQRGRPQSGSSEDRKNLGVCENS